MEFAYTLNQIDQNLFRPFTLQEFKNGTEKIISNSFYISSYRILARDKINIIFYIF